MARDKDLRTNNCESTLRDLKLKLKKKKLHDLNPLNHNISPHRRKLHLDHQFNTLCLLKKVFIQVIDIGEE